MLEVKRAAVAEVQRAVAVAVAESRASERLRVHRLLDLPLSQRSHVGVRQASFVRVHGSPNVVETSGRTAPTPTTTSNSAPSTTEDDKDAHLTNIVGSVCTYFILPKKNMYIYPIINAKLKKEKKQ